MAASVDLIAPTEPVPSNTCAAAVAAGSEPLPASAIIWAADFGACGHVVVEPREIGAGVRLDPGRSSPQSIVCSLTAVKLPSALRTSDTMARTSAVDLLLTPGPAAATPDDRPRR